PKEGVCDQEIANFVAAEVENERAPIHLLALARIHVFVEIGPVKFGQPMCVFREMRRDPIHDHPHSGLMTFVDKMAELVRCPKATGWRVIVGNLIPPGTFKRMLRNW